MNFTLWHFERSHRRRLISQHRHRVIPNMNNRLCRTYLKLQFLINKYCMKMLPILEFLISINAIFREKVSKNTHIRVCCGGKETGKSGRRVGGGGSPKRSHRRRIIAKFWLRVTINMNNVLCRTHLKRQITIKKLYLKRSPC